MANPYGMAEFSIPQLIGIDMQMKQSRLEQMYRHQQQERADIEFGHKQKEWDRADKRTALLAKIYGAGDPDASPATVTSSPQSPGAPVPPSGAAPGEPASPAPPVAPVRSDGLRVNQQALNELFAIDPETALQVREWSQEADKEQLTRIQQHGEVIAQAAFPLQRIPAGSQRQAAFQAMIPDLRARGFSEQELAQVDLSDQGITRYLTMGQSLADLITQAREDRKEARDDKRLGLESQRVGIAAGGLDLARKREGRVEKWGPQPLFGTPGGIPTQTNDLDY